MLTLLKKEISSFFSSLIGYIVIVVFLIANSTYIWLIPGDQNVLDTAYANLDTLFVISPLVFLFLVPAVTMRLFADEKKSGTIELLLTRPLSDLKIVIVKFLAGLILVLFSILPTLLYFITIYLLGDPVGSIDTGGTFGSYIGLFFLAGIYVAIGVFASSITENQIIAFLISLVICFVFYLGFDSLSSIEVFKPFEGLLRNLGINEHYISMSRGVVDLRDMNYFLTTITIFIFLTKITLRGRTSGKISRKNQSSVHIDSELLKNRKSIRMSNLINILLTIIAIGLISFILSFVSFRYDLTAEGRYTLSDKTIELVEGLEDVVFVKIYLGGDLPYGMKRLKDATRELLDELRVYAGDNIEYELINPSEEPDEKARKQIFSQLAKKGLNPISLQERDDEGGVSQKIIFPGAIVMYRSKETVINLLKSGIALSPDQALNNSINELEYEVSKAIRKVITNDYKSIGFIEGHGELTKMQVGDFTEALAQNYYVDRVKLSGHLDNVYEIKDYSVLIVAKPSTYFSEQDKFILDQYVMNGGKIVWLLDFVRADLDSLVYGPALGIFDPNGLENQIYTYGARINPNLILDVRCARIPVPGVMVGSQDKYELAPWYYYPVVLSNTNHPIVKNLNPVKLEFPSYIDTVGLDPGVKKTFLLHSSEYTKIVNAPARISLDIVRGEPDKRQFNKKAIPVAVLLEGEFESNFLNKSPELLKRIEAIEGLEFKDKSVPTKMVVVADGDIIRNKVKGTGERAFYEPLGQDYYSPEIVYEGNKEFLLNVVDYLCDDSGLMSIRARDHKLRMLDIIEVRDARLKWQLINTVLPVLFIILFGLALSVIRKRKYSK